MKDFNSISMDIQLISSSIWNTISRECIHYTYRVLKSKGSIQDTKIFLNQLKHMCLSMNIIMCLNFIDIYLNLLNLSHYVPGYLTHYVPGYLTHYVPGYFINIHKMGPIVIYYHVNTIGREFIWTRKDCSQMRTVGYNGLMEFTFVCNLKDWQWET